MPALRECPLCGGTMRLTHAEPVATVPGSPTTSPTPSPTRSPEWVCPDCDYFEEAEEEGS